MSSEFPSSIFQQEKTLKFFRTCVILVASIEMVVAALSTVLNLAIFTYYVIAASKGVGIKSTFFFENIIVPDLKISAKTFSKIAAFMFVFSVIHFVASVFLYQGAKMLSHDKCRWSLILHICLWTIGILVVIAPLTDKVTIWLFVIVFSFKIAEVALIKRFMDELSFQGYHS